jgi:hypothetical protein
VKLTTHLKLVHMSGKCVLYVYSSIRLHGVVPNYLSTATILLFLLDNCYCPVSRPGRFISREKNHQFPPERELVVAQSPFGRFVEVKILLRLPEIEIRFRGRPALVLVLHKRRYVMEKGHVRSYTLGECWRRVIY